MAGFAGFRQIPEYCCLFVRLQRVGYDVHQPPADSSHGWTAIRFASQETPRLARVTAL
jgi:hypothetical protein